MLKRDDFWYHEGCPEEGQTSFPKYSLNSGRTDGVLQCRNCSKVFPLCNYIIRMSKACRKINMNFDFVIKAHSEYFKGYPYKGV